MTLSKEKTQLIKSFGNPVYSIEILGYEFVVKGNTVETQHTKVKNEKMYKRLDAVFTRFDKLLKCDYKSAKSYLFDALRILTANTNLHNNKKRIKIGAYYSNQILDDSSVLSLYDNYLAKKIESISLSITGFSSEVERTMEEAELKSVLLKNASFVKGFDSRKRFCISKQRLQYIKNTWL